MKTQAPVINIKPYEDIKDESDNIIENLVSDDKPLKPSTAEAGERIQKVLARGGVGSRREVERWIKEGRLLVNGEKANLGHRLVVGDTLQLNGRPLKWEKFTVQATQVLIYHKPTGEVVTRHDPEGRPVIFSKLPKLQVGRWIAVGRLDINTQGLLLLTNNGELANRLMHPSSEIDREYAVRILGEVSEENLTQLKAGIELEDGLAKFDDIVFNGGEGANRWYHVTVKEGRNRLVRRLWEALDFQVSRLMRVRYGPIFLPDGLSARQCHELTPKELDDLLTFVGLPVERFEQKGEVRSTPEAKKTGTKIHKKDNTKFRAKRSIPEFDARQSRSEAKRISVENRRPKAKK